MKTRYSRKARFLSPSGVAAGAAVVGVLALFFLLRLAFPSAFAAAVSPLLHAGNAVASVHLSFGGGAAVSAERDRLREENALLAAENMTLRAKLTDIGAAQEGALDGSIIAGVVTRPPLSPYDTLLIGKGSKDGVREGAIAFSGSVPVGSVVEVGPGSARVLLYSASGRVSEGWVGEARLPVTVIGEGAGSFSIDLPREMPVAAGDIVYLPGPGAFAVGTVYSVESHASSPSAKVRITPLTSPFSLTEVRVVSP